MQRVLSATIVILLIFSFSNHTFSQISNTNKIRYFSFGSSIGLPGQINILTSYNHKRYSIRLSGIYTGTYHGAPNGVELSLFYNIYESKFTHRILYTIGHGQMGNSLSNLQIYYGFGYNLQWKSIFAEIRFPTFHKNGGGYTGWHNYLKFGYIYSLR